MISVYVDCYPSLNAPNEFSTATEDSFFNGPLCPWHEKSSHLVFVLQQEIKTMNSEAQTVDDLVTLECRDHAQTFDCRENSRHRLKVRVSGSKTLSRN